jgi:uncharacterized protein YndB with AHSA1/START domain
MEITVEVPGTPEQVWQAIATGNGISSWFLPTDLDEREGGVVRFHMGETDSEGSVTRWEPPTRLEYSEPEWAELTGHDPSSVTPLVTEFLVEARSGGTCVVHVVSSAFGSGDWEEEFFEHMKETWLPFFDNLRLYLARFPGQQVTSLEADAQFDASAEKVLAAMQVRLGVDSVGQSVEANGLRGSITRLGSQELFIELEGSPAGYFGAAAFDTGDGSTVGVVRGWLFSDDARDYVDRQQPTWKAWLETLAIDSPSTAKTSA